MGLEEIVRMLRRMSLSWSKIRLCTKVSEERWIFTLRIEGILIVRLDH